MNVIIIGAIIIILIAVTYIMVIIWMTRKDAKEMDEWRKNKF